MRLKKSTHVRTLSDSVWIVEKDGVSRARSDRYASQKEATSAARKAISNRGGGELHIHGRDGRIRDSDTVAPKDPASERNQDPGPASPSSKG